MLTRMVRRLRIMGLLPVPARSSLVILNHNPDDPARPGDVDLFATPEALAGDIHGGDVRSGAYMALDTTGRLVTLTPLSPAADATVTASVARHATHASLALDMLKHYLRRAIDDESLTCDVRDVEREHDVRRLVAMVPAGHVQGYYDGAMRQPARQDN